MRAIERPPVDVDKPWRPWLVRVATNLRHDAPPGLAARWIYTIDLDAEGKIRRSYAVLATEKLTAIAF